MDAEIQFGEVEEAEIGRALRPDRNRHYAVVTCGRPSKKDLPVFVDLDVMRDMEEHAQSDTTVELGGVMLGGQHEDENGDPFVLVTDSLRAEHYKATKGSFKFTHETWETISRQRNEFPEDLQMVGWYHTHPDWGVFLSTMDLFICENFFKRPLDLALVIDPCRDDRGFFQWLDGGQPKTDRVDGYYLVASRFRRDELQWYADQLEGEPVMQGDAGRGFVPQRMPAPVVNISDSRSGWLGGAVIGMLVLQACLMLLVAWRVLVPATPAAPPAAVAESEEIKELRRRVDALQLERSAEERLAAQRELLDRVLDEVEVAPGGLVTSLEEERAKNRDLQKDLELIRLGSQAVTQQNAELESAVTDLKGEIKTLTAQRTEIKRLNEEEIERLNSKITALTTQVNESKALTEDTKPEDGAGGGNGGITWFSLLLITVFSVVLLAGIGGGVFVWWRGRHDKDDDQAAMASNDDPPNENDECGSDDAPSRDAVD